MTTTNDINRGGRPLIYDWKPLAERVRTFEDVELLEAALREHSSHPTRAAGCANAVRKVASGDPTGGVSRQTGYDYRKMLAELTFDPLKPPGGRRRALRELASQRGSAESLLLAGGALAGAVALALFSPSEAVRAFGLLAADNARTDPGRLVGVDSGGSPPQLSLVLVGGVRECVPGARQAARATRVGYALAEVA